MFTNYSRMARLHYISPSLIPSSSANSVHVLQQCHAFWDVGVDISLYAKRSIFCVYKLPSEIQRCYGIDVKSWHLFTFHSFFSCADTLLIAVLAIGPVLLASHNDIVLSRNLYAAWLLSIFRRPILFETHQLEYGIRKFIQKWVITRPCVRTVAISESLVLCLEEHLAVRIYNPLVLHDAAPDGIERLEPQDRRHYLADLLKMSIDDLKNWIMVCGYFGQLYEGRGIEIIEAMAFARPSSLFLVFGGSCADVASRRMTAPSNLCYLGHVPHPFAMAVQAAVDVLLMPYQHNVSIGIKGHDTARWMSPMKMFEYLAAGVPIISSDLPALKEILDDTVNSLLVPHDKVQNWISALDLLTNDPKLANSIGSAAHSQYRDKHTWKCRALSLLAFAKDL